MDEFQKIQLLDEVAKLSGKVHENAPFRWLRMTASTSSFVSSFAV